MQKSIRHILIYATSAGIMALLPVLVLPIIANTLGSAGFGLFSTGRFTMQVAVLLVGSFLGFGLSRVFFDQPIDQYYGRINGSMLITALLAATIFALVLAFWWMFGLNTAEQGLWLLFNPAISIWIILGAAGFVWRQNYHRVLVMLPRPGLAASSELTYNLLVFAGFLLVLNLGWTWQGMIALQAALFLLTAFISLGIVMLVCTPRGVLTMDWEWSHANLYRSFPFIVAGLVTPLLLSMDKLIITAVLDVEHMGIYSATSLYLSGTFLLSGVFQKVYVPRSYQLLSQYQESKDLIYLKAAQKRFGWAFWGILPVVVALCIACTVHAEYAFDAEYAAAVPLVWIVVLAGSSSFIQIALIPFFDSFNKGDVLSALAFAGLVVSCMSIYWGTLCFGIRGAAWGLLFGQSLYSLTVLGTYKYSTLVSVQKL